MTHQPSADLKAVCTGIGAGLRTQLSDVLREPTPDKMTDLLKEIDQPPAAAAQHPSKRPVNPATSAPTGTQIHREATSILFNATLGDQGRYSNRS